MTKKNVDRAVLALLLVMAVLLYYSTANYTGIAKATSAKYVRFLAVSIGTLTAVQLLYSVLRDRSTNKLILTENLTRFGILLAALIAFAAVFDTLGFFIPAAIFIPAMTLVLGYRRPVVIAAVTFGVLAFVYLVFIQLLAVNLPGINF